MMSTLVFPRKEGEPILDSLGGRLIVMRRPLGKRLGVQTYYVRILRVEGLRLVKERIVVGRKGFQRLLNGIRRSRYSVHEPIRTRVGERL